MNNSTFLIALLITTVSFETQAAPEVLPLDVTELREMELESIPPFPAEIVLKGESKNWEQVGLGSTKRAAVPVCAIKSPKADIRSRRRSSLNGQDLPFVSHLHAKAI